MLFKHKHLLEELRKKGRQGTGEILSMRTIGQGSSIRATWAPDEDLTTGWFDCWMKLRVVPEDQSDRPFEATVTTRIHTLKTKGSRVPVWYDPDDHSKLVVDYEADVQQKMNAGADVDRLLHRNDQRLGLVWTPLGDSLLPFELMAKRGKGRLAAGGKVRDFVEAAGDGAMSWVRDNVASLAPELDGSWFATNDVQLELAWGGAPHGITLAEGRSAGVALAVGLVSLLSGHIVRPEVALTGRLSATGELLPVDHFKEKALAAKKGHTKRFIAPAENKQEAWKISEHDRHEMECVFVSTMDEALHASLAKRPWKGR